MTPTIRRLRREDGVEPLLAALDADGGAILEDALDPLSLARLDRALTPWFEAAACGEGPFFGKKTRRFSGVFAKSRETIPLAIDPLIQQNAETTLGAGTRRCDKIQLNLTQAIGIGPGEPPQHPHRDDDFFPFAHEHALMINVLWTLDPFTHANGATRMVPGSHRWHRKRAAQDHEWATAEAPAGAAIFWLGETLHGGGGNETDALRRGLVMSYSAAWLAPAEKLLLSIPVDIARGLPRRLAELIGYQIHRPNLGWVEGRDPVEWLQGLTGPLAAARDNLTPVQEASLASLLEGR